MGFSTRFLSQKLVIVIGNFMVSLSTYFLPLFRFFRAKLFRFKRNGSCFPDNPNHSGISCKESSGKDSSTIEPKPVLEPLTDTVVEPKEVSIDSTRGFTQKETPEFCFKFKFPSYEEFSRSRREIGDSISLETTPETSNTKYEFMPFRGSNDSIEATEVVTFCLFSPKEQITDTNVGPSGEKDSLNSEAKSIAENRAMSDINSEATAMYEESAEESSSDSCMGEVQEKMTFEEEMGNGNVYDENQVPSEEESLAMDSGSESFSSSPLRSFRNGLIDAYSDGFLSDGDFRGEMADYDETHVEEHQDSDFDGEDDTYTIEGDDLQNVRELNSDFLSENDFRGKKCNSNDKQAEKEDDAGKVNSKNATDWDSEDSNKLETLWEHQELIEQLKMELKKVKATGLPTILEESEESPKIMEDLKPWKIDEKFQRGDRMDDLHKLYRSYRERMRKFDILNYQKMYAIGFLQLKDPLQSISSSQKSSVPSVLLQSFSFCKPKKTGSDPTMKFIKELQSELEVVYVGQMCLSWEILHWQYGKALELWDSDPRGVRQYNEVAGEFQQFQVLVQRFIEDEPFQGPRVQNYVKNRCILRNLLQVPVIREDSKDRKKAMKRRETGDHVITNDELVEIMEESIRIFWRFVRADKESSNVILKCRKGPHAELQDPADSELLIEVQTNLQKKEKRLRDLLRSGNCILKRFQKRDEDDGTDHVLYFFSQVDMKLVARVLNMSRITTDQLLWCRNKLTKISFINRKICVEPSFLLFPC